MYFYGRCPGLVVKRTHVDTGWAFFHIDLL